MAVHRDTDLSEKEALLVARPRRSICHSALALLSTVQLALDNEAILSAAKSAQTARVLFRHTSPSFRLDPALLVRYQLKQRRGICRRRAITPMALLSQQAAATQH